MEEKPRQRRWFRFSLRTLFIVVTVVSFAPMLVYRHREFKRQAEFHQNAYAHADSYLERMRDELGVGQVLPGVRAFLIDPFEAIRDHHFQLHEKYRKAARYPWLSVEPDPPLPPEVQEMLDAANRREPEPPEGE